MLLRKWCYEKSARLIGEQDFLTGIVRFFSPTTPNIPEFSILPSAAGRIITDI